MRGDSSTHPSNFLADSCAIRLLGSLEVSVGDQTPTFRRKTRAVLAYLAAAGQAHRRRALADMFCQEASDPAGALRWHLSRIHRQLGPGTLLLEGNMVQFNHQAGWVDCVEFRRVLEQHAASLDLETLVGVVDLYRGEFLAGAALPDAPEFELWLLGQRVHLSTLYERGLFTLVSRLIALERYAEAISWTQKLVQSNPLLEQAHARLIWLYAQTGQRQAALRQFDHCRDLLRAELAVEPSPELQALRAEVAAGQSVPPYAAVPVSVAEESPRSASFVGREAELVRLHQAWEAACQGRGAAVLLEAEAGGGKTRLAHEFGQSLSGASFLFGQCYESTRDLPYHPWIELLETHLASSGHETIDQLSPLWLDYLMRLLPTLAQRLDRRVPTPPPTSGGEVEYLFPAVAEFLFRSGRCTRPLLIFVDDLQWADESSLRLFHFLARRIMPAKALLVGAFRPEEVDGAPALQTLIGDLQRGPLIRLRLPPLTRASITTLIAQLWPDLPPGYRSHVCAMLAQATGGNPFFATEVLRELAHATQVPTTLPVPASVRDLICRRLRRLPESGRQVVEAVAVLGSSVTLAQAQQTSARSEEETVTALDLGLRRGLLQTQAGSRPARYDFVHELVHEAVAGQLSDVRRRLLHRRAADTLARTTGHLPSAQRQELAGRIARHAVEGQDFEQVLEWSPRAAERARRLYAYTDALAAYQVAHEALEQVQGKIPPDTAAHKRTTLLLGQIEMLGHLGRWSEQATLLQTAADTLARWPDAQLQAMFHLCRACYLHAIGEYQDAYQATQRAREGYLQLGDEQRAADALREAGTINLSVGQIDAGHDLLNEALALYRAGGDVHGENRCIIMLAYCAMDMGEIQAALGHLERALEISEQQGDKLARAQACFVMAVAWCYYYHAERIRVFAQEALELSQALGNEALTARALTCLAASHYVGGDPVQAQPLYEQALAGAQDHQDVWIEGWVAQMLGRIALDRGDLPAAKHWLNHANQLRQDHGEVHNQIGDLARMGRLALRQGQPAQALGYTTRAVEYLDELSGQVWVFEVQDVLMCHAEALAAAGRHEKASTYVQRAYDSLLLFAEQIVDPQVKRGFLSSPLNAHIVSAWENGQV